MILTGNEIERQVCSGSITISPFSKKQINPNSYNYRLDKYYRVLSEGSNENMSYSEILEIPKEGLVLSPQTLYLADTFEEIGSEKYVTYLIGRSSVGRLGLFVQISADLGNLGSPHHWTLELHCIQPVIIYPNMIIGQVSFWLPIGDIELYKGDYNKYNFPQGKMN